MKQRVAIVLALLALAVAAAAQQHPNQEKGFDAGKLYQFDSIDNINLFNGNLVLTVPIGQKYPAGGALSYGFTLIYNGNPWIYSSTGATQYLRATPTTRTNAGLGWHLSLGRLIPPEDPTNETNVVDSNYVPSFIYESPDGADHILCCETPANPPVFALDDANIRMTKLTSAMRRIDLPDGTVQTFEDRPYPMTGSNPDWRLTKISDPFNNWVAVGYSADGNVWTVSDSASSLRSHILTFRKVSPPTDGVSIEQTVLDSIDLAAFDGSRAHYAFSYMPLAISRPAEDNTGLNKVPGAPYTMEMLTKVDLPNGESYSMTKDDTPNYWADSRAGIRGLRLPTMGWLEWDWEIIEFPERTSQIFAQGDALHTGQDSDPIPDIVLTHKRSFGIKTRRKLDENRNLIGTWQYNRIFSSALLEPCTVTSVRDDGKTYTKKNFIPAVMTTAVIEPANDGDAGCASGCPVTATYFSVYSEGDASCLPSENTHHFSNVEYGLSMNRYLESGGRYLAVQNGFKTGGDLGTAFITGAAVLPGLLRSKYSAFADSGPFDGHHETSSRTFDYATVPSSSSQFAAGEYSETFTALRDHVNAGATVWGPPRFRLSGGTVGGQTHYKATFTNYPTISSSTVLSVNTPWILGPYTEKCAAEYSAFPGAGGVPALPSSCSELVSSFSPSGTTMEQACFNNSTGYLRGRRIRKTPSAPLAPPSPNDVVALFDQSGGNTLHEAWFGADDAGNPPPDDYCTFLPSGGTYRYDYSYSNGALASAKTRVSSAPDTWLYTVKQDINPYTGRVSKTFDGATDTMAGFETLYNYDDAGRLTSVIPETGAQTEYRYTIATGTTTHAAVDVVKHPDGNTSAVLTLTGYEFDALGRIIEQRTVMPDGRMSRQQTIYYPRGLKWKTSELENAPQHFTVFTYDALGRVLTATAPDSAITTYQYGGAASQTRTAKVAMTHPATTLSNASTTERYDALGRLIGVTDGVGTTASYTYDVMDHLSTVDIGTQQRTFKYDARGFLTEERHPESNKITYSSFDPKGHARQKSVDGGHTITFAFDGAERIKSTSDETTILKENTYDTVVGTDGVTYSRPGHLLKSVRHNLLPVDRTVSEYFKYEGPGQSLSSKETVVAGSGFTELKFSQPISYDELGLVDKVTYPGSDQIPAAERPPSREVQNVHVHGLLTEVRGFTKPSPAIGYAGNGMVTSIAHANGVTDTIVADPNGMTRPASISFTAEICPLPAFTVQVQPSSVTSGGSAQIMVTPTDGSTGNVYEFFRGTSTNPLTSTLMRPASTNASYDTDALTQTTSYWVRVTRACDRQQSSGLLTIQVTAAGCTAPVITTHPVAPGTVASGSVVHLSSAASGSGSLSYQWYANGAAIPGATSTSLDYTVYNTTSFYMTASTCATATSNTVTAIVTAASSCPQPVVVASASSIWLGQTVTVSTNAPGTQFEWHQGIQGIFYGDQLVPEAQGGHSSSITVRPAQHAYFWVMITSPCSSAHSESVTVDVYPPPAGDLNSDGRSDFVWRNYTDGTTSITNNYSLPDVLKSYYGGGLTNPDWHVNGFADVDGDYYPDLIWHNNATGANTLWTLANDPLNPYGVPDPKPLPAITTNGVADPDWRLVGAGDIDGGTPPRRAELFFRNYRTGANRVVWPSVSGTSIASSIDFQAETDLDWKIVGVVGIDLTTYQAKVIWRNTTTGQNRLWYLSLLSGTISVTVGTPPPAVTDQNWQIEGAGDFDGIGGQGLQVAWRAQSTGVVRISTLSGNLWLDNYLPSSDANPGARIQLGGDFDACVTPTVTITASGPLTICNGSVHLTASAQPSRASYTYHWSSGQNGAAIDASASGTYIVTVTSSEGCVATASVTIAVAPAVTPTITASTGSTGVIDITAGEQVVLTSSSASSYLWSTGATTASIITGTPGTYSVTTTDSNGCTATSATRQLVVHPRPPISVTATASRPNGVFVVAVSWTAPPNTSYTYLVQRSADGHNFVTVSNPDTSVAANATYIYRVYSLDGTLSSLTAGMDLATTVVFTNDPLVRRVTLVSSIHLTEVRNAINCVRNAAGLTPATWTALNGNTTIAAAHVTEMRARLNEALVILGAINGALGPPTYTDPALAPGMPIRLEHIQEIRERVK